MNQINQSVITVSDIRETIRTNKQYGTNFKVKILTTDKLGCCSIGEKADGFWRVVAGETYIVTYSKNGSFINIQSAYLVPRKTVKQGVHNVNGVHDAHDVENTYEPSIDFDSATPDFDIEIPDGPQDPKPQATNQNDVSVLRTVLDSIEKMQKTLVTIGGMFCKLAEEYKALKAELESRG